MRIPESLKTKQAEEAFLAALVVIVLLLLPALPLGKYGGGIAMVITSFIGLVAYLILFRERLRARPGGLKIVLFSIAVGAIGAVVAIWLRHGRAD